MKIALITFIVLTVLMIYLVGWRIVIAIRAKPLIKATLLDIKKSFTNLKSTANDDSQYLRYSSFILLKEKLANLEKQLRELQSIFFRKQIKELLREIKAFENSLTDLRESINDRFFQEEKVRAKHIFFDNHGNDLLTEEQLKAVLCDDNRNLIIAGAGSGKTRVIDFKVRYLVNYKNLTPSKILLLSFSKKSAGDLLRKISENIPGIDARTIHSFSSQVLGKQNRKVFDESNKEFESFVIKALVLALKDQRIFNLFEEFYQKFFSDIKPLIFYKNLDELRKDLKKLNSKLIDTPDRFGEIKARRSLKTLKGDYVRSVDERYIADFLYLQDIKYEYEKRYFGTDELYYPDFYLPDYDIYLEHFAITNTGEPPAYFDNPQKYMDGIKWKRDLHIKKNTRMIESYSYLLNAGKTSLYLSELLAKHGIEVQDHLENDDVYSKISREFCRVFTRFYHSFKLSGLSLDALKQKYNERKYLLFLQLFENFLIHFENMVTQENKMDFNDMIIGAITKYRTDGAPTFEYIIVDEFQDTSNLAMKLLDEVYQSNPQTIFLSVGDDWQSIYGFNGSDVSIFSDYVKKYSGVSVQNLNSNFRSHARVVELGKKFISKNPTQIQKNVISGNKKFKDSEIDFLSFEQMEKKIRRIPDDESIFILYRYNDDSFAIQNAFKDFFTLDRNRRPVRKASCAKNIAMMTIHASKGLEAQHVFLVFPDGVKKKFPSEIEDHFIFNMLKTNGDDFPFSEERRLMYVAITRAEQNLYFVSPNNEPNSIFWDELKEIVRS